MIERGDKLERGTQVIAEGMLEKGDCASVRRDTGITTW